MNRKVSFVSDERAPGEAREAVRGELRGLPDDLIDSAVLLTTELVTNSARHAALAAGQGIFLHLTVDERALRIEVFDASDEPPVMRSQQDDGSLSIGGWGLRLVDRLSDRWGTRSGAGGKVVWCELDLPGAQR